MKLQHLIIIFLIIMLPMALIMSQYTGLQIDTISMKTKYDTALSGATFDTMAAFELNTINSESSSVIGEEIRDLEAVISTFSTSLASSLGIAGVSKDYILSYVPAMVFGLYDGYYIYAQTDEGKGKELKPYVYYTKTYSYGNTDITIAYSLDNYVSIYGKYGGKTISAAGYLVIPEEIEVSPNFAYVSTTDENGETTKKVIDPGTKSGGQQSWVKYKNYDIYPETIYENKTFSDKDEMLINQAKDSTEAMMYYYEAKQFTEIYNKVIRTLGIEDINTLYIDSDNNPEDETSPFMNEKINVMKDSITSNLNLAIYNYEGAVSENYEMPQLTGEDWEKILNNVSITAFLKNIPIGTTHYNNYVVVNSTTNQKYASSKSIDFIGYDENGKTYGYFHKITCDKLIEDIENISQIIGYASVDFERYKYSIEDSDQYYYYYKHNEYADYECEVESIENQNVATIEEYITNKTKNETVARDKILKSYYTAVGRIRYRLIKASSYINLDDTTKNFKVRYYPNGGYWTKGNPEVVSSANGKLQVISEIPAITGKTFMGWSKNKNANVAEVKLGDTIYGSNDKEIELYAIYANQYTVTYNLNGGVGGPTPNVQTKTSGIDYKISSTKPTKEGGIFLGWSTNVNATNVEYQPGDTYTKDENVTLYAVWTSQTVKIRYNTMGGSAVPTQEKAVGATIKLQGTPILVGSVFKGWSTKPGGNVEYLVGSDYSEDLDKILYAIWETTTFRITYDANGGNLSADLQNVLKCTKLYGMGYIILTSQPIREAYTFIGWSTDPNARVGDIKYAAGSIYTANSNLTLYAVWEGEEYTVQYDANGGTNTPELQITKKDRDVNITTNKPVRDGYEFMGWSTNPLATQSGVQYRGGETYTGRTGIKLYAIWKKSTYTITYDTKGGSPTPANQNKEHGRSIHITTTRPSKENYYFEGWSTDKNATTKQYSANEVYSENKSVTLYAVWGAGYYTITYNANGGRGAPENQEIQIGTNTNISSTIPVRDGYSFQGWSRNRDAITGDTNYAPGSTYLGSSSLELYAVWSENGYGLTVNPNGGTWRGTYNSTTLSLGMYTEIDIESPIPPIGYVFSGWNVISGDAIIALTHDGNYRINMGLSNSTISAQYTAMDYFLVYDKNTIDTVANIPTAQRIKYNSRGIIPIITPVRSGYTFQGWSTDKNATIGDTNYAPGKSFIMPNRDITLYAVWSKILDSTPPTITITLEEGKAQSENISEISVKATIQISDAYGVATRKCSINTNPNNLGTSIDSYSNTLGNNTSVLTLNFSSTGTYYLHVLAIDIYGNAKEEISKAIKVKESEGNGCGGGDAEWWCATCGASQGIGNEFGSNHEPGCPFDGSSGNNGCDYHNNPNECSDWDYGEYSVSF